MFVFVEKIRNFRNFVSFSDMFDFAGWNDWPEHFTEETPCMLTEKKGYIVYSSLGQCL